MQRQVREHLRLEPERRARQARLAKLRQMELEKDAATRHSPAEQRVQRCALELRRKTPVWSPVTADTVKNGHQKEARGMFYDLLFPWSEETLAQFGANWLTTAFRAAGTLPADNRVTEIVIGKRVTAGNNGGKFFFDVKYKRPSLDLHTKLFAKVPYPMTTELSTDRVSSSVLKQPMDFSEINTYRLLESKLPFRTPKYYFGDISNETTNFILVLERIEYKGRGELEPFEIEGPYEKCQDFLLPRAQSDYYFLLMRQSAKLAGLHRAGKMVSQQCINENLISLPASPDRPEQWGCNPGAASGEDPRTLSSKVDLGISFISDTASVLFPSYVKEETVKQRMKNVLMTVSAYANEINYWKHCDTAYVALGHQNLNIDNAFFWKDAMGELDCGVLDWGGFGDSSLSHKLWWSLNTAEFENVQENLRGYIRTFIDTYKEWGGPDLDMSVVEMGVVLTALQNCLQMVLAIPNCFKMCPNKEWTTIKDRHDPRIANNIHDKSTLRTTLAVLVNNIRLLFEMDGCGTLDSWIQEIWVGRFDQPPKAEQVIFGR